MKENIYPFLWLRDEPTEKIYREIDAIKELTDGFIVESRPKKGVESDFGSESWFKRVGEILAYAQKSGMKVWILDDKSYPTDFANGAIIEKYPQLRAKQIKADIVDFYSDGNPCFLRAGIYAGEELFAAFVLKGKKAIKISGGENGIFPVKLGKGAYRAVFLIITENCPERDGFIDMLNGESTDVLIKEIYEPYYKRFKEYFGNTLTGFFSDEPRFCNGVNPYYFAHVDMYGNKAGNTVCAFPFSRRVAEEMFRSGFSEEDFISLFLPFGDYARFRSRYMSVITDLYAENFNEKLSKWCNARGVIYTGHVIEDGGVHYNLGCGAGHYFKATRGSDYAGVDVVLHQIKPFVKYNSVAPIEGGFTDYKFYAFTLARLASSSSAQSVKSRGGLVELFGAYGWGESVKTMLYLVNHFAVNGVGYFVPHAFSMNLYDTDCPPYFYAENANPAYDGYRLLFDYMRRLGKTVNSGTQSRVAVYYNAEAVWSGKKSLSVDDVAKVLAENQIEFDFIDYDNLNGSVKTEDCIMAGKASYSLLVVPHGYLPHETEKLIESLKIPVVYADGANVKNLAERVNEKLKRSYFFEKPAAGLRSQTFNDGSIMLFNAYEKTVKNVIYRRGAFYVCDFLRKEIRGKYEDSADFTLKAGEAVIVCKTPPADFVKARSGKVVRDIKGVTVTEKAVDGKISEAEYRVSFGHTTDGGFSGFIEYVFTAELKENEYLSIDFYGEYLRVEAQDVASDYISSPALVDVGTGTKTVKISVCNTLAGYIKDELSLYDKISSCGVKRIKVLKEL